MSEGTKQTTFNFPVSTHKFLQAKASELSTANGHRVSMKDVVEYSLMKAYPDFKQAIGREHELELKRKVKT